MSTIGACLIIKNEESVIQRCLDSIKPLVDYVCVVDTGSSDSSIAKVNEWLNNNSVAGRVHTEEWIDFATNRSSALKKIRSATDIDYVLVIDADEVIEYDCSFDVHKFKSSLVWDVIYLQCKYGGCCYNRPSLFKNNKPFYYKGILHEYLECETSIDSTAVASGITNIPLQDSLRNKQPDKYKRDAAILEKALENEVDPFLVSRYNFYLAQSYKDCGQLEDAIRCYSKRATLGGWPEEIYVSLNNVACLKEQLSYPEEEVIQSFFKAIEVRPTRIEAYYNLIRFCRLRNKNYLGYIIGKHAISLPVDKTGLFVDYWMWDYGIYDEFSLVCFFTGHITEAIEAVNKSMQKAPPSYMPRLADNLKHYANALKEHNNNSN